MGFSKDIQQFRFFDNREKYLLFVSTCNEKQVIADRIKMDMTFMNPPSSGLRVFDAGMGDATVLSQVMRFLHHKDPKMPLLVVAKELSHEDVRISLDKMADRFCEHPRTVLTLTNMLYSEAPRLYPNSRAMQQKLNWVTIPIEGSTAYAFNEQIKDLKINIQDWWQTKTNEITGNSIYTTPTVVVIYRKDHEKSLTSIIPMRREGEREYDLMIASQPFRSRSSAESKVKYVLAPLSRSLAPSGVMVVVQSTGKDPGMEIIRDIWPGEDPFPTSREDLLKEMHFRLSNDHPDLRFLSYPDSRARFRYDFQLPYPEATSSIGTSTIMAAWNAATYVAQIDDDLLTQAMSSSDYMDVVLKVTQRHDGLWFADESFAVARVSHENQGIRT